MAVQDRFLSCCRRLLSFAIAIFPYSFPKIKFNVLKTDSHIKCMPLGDFVIFIYPAPDTDMDPDYTEDL